jgi:uncharacterized membrane protein YccC
VRGAAQAPSGAGTIRAVFPSLGGSPAAPAWRQAGAALLAGIEDSLFALKTVASAILAFWIALRIGLDRPYWAVTTCLIVAQPLAGAVLSKALFRLIGTVAGAAAAIVLVPLLVNTPELLTLALALWLGLCTYVSMLDRSPRAYLFLLAGYTAAIIGFPAISRPDAIFDIASIRAQEIGIGILCSAFVHGLAFPRSVTSRLRSRATAMILDARRLSSRLLDPESREIDHHLHTRLVRDIGELDLLLTHLPFDMSRRPVRGDALRALQHQLMHVLALSGAVGDRLMRIGPHLSAATAARIEMVRSWLDDDGPHDDMPRAIRSLEPDPAEVRQLDEAMQLSLLDRLADLVAAHDHCRQLGEMLERGSAPPRNPAILAVAHKPHRHLDHHAAMRGAAATILTVAGCSLLWIASAWPDGAGAVVLGSILCALFANLEDPMPSGRGAVAGVLLGSAIALVYDFAILPRITDFPVLAAALSPALILVAFTLTLPGGSPVAIGMILVVPGLLMLGRSYDGDFSAFANSSVAQLVGAVIAMIALRLVRGIGSETRIRQLASAGRTALDRHFRQRTGARKAALAARMLDRVGLISAMPSADEDERTAAIVTMLKRVRMGMSIDQLRAIQMRTSGRDAALIDLLLRRTRLAIGQGSRQPDRVRLSATTSLALRRLCRSAPPADRRTAIIATVGLWCNA